MVASIAETAWRARKAACSVSQAAVSWVRTSARVALHLRFGCQNPASRRRARFLLTIEERNSQAHVERQFAIRPQGCQRVGERCAAERPRRNVASLIPIRHAQAGRWRDEPLE